MDNLPILRQINGEIEDFKTKRVQIVPGFTHSQWDVLQRIYHYHNSHFSSGNGIDSLDPMDDDGDRMYFYNISKNPCKVTSKAIDFDTKNIRLLTVEGQDPLKTWYMERDLKFWMRDVAFGKTLNRLFREIPVNGTVVLKIVDGQPYFVDLRHFVVDQSAEDLDSTGHIIEIHNFTIAQFRKAAKTMGWDSAKVTKTIEEFHKMKGVSKIRVYERYGEIESIDEEGKSSYTNKRVFYADVGVDEYDQRGDLKMEKQGVELSSQEWEEHPYWEFHMDKMSGRWLGVGVVETLFEPQIRHNQLANLQSKASTWLSMHIWQTRDTGFNRNISSDVKNGEVLVSESEIHEVVVADRNLAHFTEEYRKWISNRDELTFSYDVVQGERLPAGTPLGSAQIAQSQTLSYFEQIQEDIALQIKEMIYQVIIPKFLADSSDEHKLRLVGQDLDEFIAMNKNFLVAQEVIKLAIKSNTTGHFPTGKDRDIIESAITESIKQNREHLLTIDKNFYKDIKYDVDIDITGESVDTRVRQATVFAIMQAITADPTMTTDPTKRKMLFWMAENGGVSPTDLFGNETPKPEQMMPMMSGRAGGGVSAPALQQSVPGQASAIV